MTVETDVTKFQYTGNGSAFEFSFSPMPVLDASHIVVILTDMTDPDNPVDTTLSEGSGSSAYAVDLQNYKVVYPEDEGTPLSSSFRLTIKRVVPLTQPTDIGNNSTYHPEVVERMVDRVEMQVQQMQEQLNRTVQMPESTTEDPTTVQELLDEINTALAQLQDAIADGAVPTSRTISTTSPLTGGGDLSANRTLALANSGVTAGSYTNPTITVTAKGLVTSIASGGSAGELGWFNVADYGAVRDGTTDNKDAINDAITDLVANGGGVLYFPGGSSYYRTTGRHTITGVSASILGDGIAASKIIWDVASGGFKFDPVMASAPGAPTSEVDHLTVAGLTLMSARASGGSALHFSGIFNGVTVQRQISYRDLAIHGDDHNAAGTKYHYWTKGIYVAEGYGMSMMNVSVLGSHDISQTDTAARAIEVACSSSSAALRMDFTNVDINLYYRGMYFTGRMEGVHITNTEVAECYYALDMQGSSSTDNIYGVFISNSHFSGYVNAIRCVYVYGINLSGCLLIRAPSPSQSQCLDGNTISLNGTARTSISGNVIHGTAVFGGNAANSENGLLISGTSTGISVAGNVFFGIVGVGVALSGTAVTRARASGNSYDAVQTNWYNEGSENANADAYRGVWVTRTSNQSIPNNTLTAISWSETQVDTEANSNSKVWALSPNPTRLTVPAGVTKIRLKANTQFADPGSYTIGATIRKNGSDYSYAGRPAWSGNTGVGFLQQGLESAMLTVTAGDYFELMVIQVTGSALDIKYQDTASPGGGKQTWMEMEIVE